MASKLVVSNGHHFSIEAFRVLRFVACAQNDRLSLRIECKHRSNRPALALNSHFLHIAESRAFHKICVRPCQPGSTIAQQQHRGQHIRSISITLGLKPGIKTICCFDDSHPTTSIIVNNLYRSKPITCSNFDHQSVRT